MNIEAANVGAALDEALSHHQAGRLDVAVPLYEQILAVAPEHARALHLLGIAQLQSGKHEAAVALMEKAIARNPDQAELFNDLAQAQIASGRLDRAAQACRQAVALRPDYADARLCLAGVLNEIGAHDEAIVHYQKSIEQVVDLPDAYFGLANALMQAGRRDEAIGAYDKTLSLDPDFLGARVNLGHAHLEAQAFGAATIHYRRALELSPGNADILLSLGGALAALGKLEESLGCYEQIPFEAGQNHELASRLRNLGHRLKADGDLELAARAFARLMPSQGAAAVTADVVQPDRMVHALPERFNPDILRTVTIENVLSVEEIDRIAAVAATFDPINASIENRGSAESDVRRSTVRWLRRTPQTWWIYARLMEHILDLNDQCWRFDVNVMSDDIQYGEYGVGGHYSWHLDLGNDRLSNRKLSFSVQLSDPNDYDGGELELKIADATIIAPRARGALIVFPSFMMHRVAPVTRGVRRSLVGWISGTYPYR